MHKICIAGKNNIAINVAEYVLENFQDVELIGVFNQTDSGENSFQRSFKQFCGINNIKKSTLEEIYQESNIIFLSLEFDKIIKPSLFKSNQLYNIHFSYLPEYKGMYTSALPLLYGEEYTGVTLHKIDSGIDTGEIISQTKILLDDDITCEQLYLKYIEEGAKLVIESLQNMINKTIKSKAQKSNKSTYFSKKTIDYSNIQIDLKATAFQVKRQINAFVFPAYQLPKVFDTEVYKADITDQKSVLKAGTLINESDFHFEIATIDFNVLVFKNRNIELKESAINGDIKLLNYFIDNQYDIKQRFSNGWDLAIISAFNTQYKYLDYLINQLDWDIHTVNYNGTSLVMYLMTIASHNSEIVYLHDFLKKHKIDFSHKDYKNISFMDYAKKYNNRKVLDLINGFPKIND